MKNGMEAFSEIENRGTARHRGQVDWEETSSECTGGPLLGTSRAKKIARATQKMRSTPPLHVVPSLNVVPTEPGSNPHFAHVSTARFELN